MEQDPVLESLQNDEGSAKMLSLVSHKLKTPLSIINGYSEAILSQSAKEKFSPFTAKALEEINKQGTKLCNLVDKLLFFNKVEALQPKDLAKKSINLKNLVKTSANDAISHDEETATVSAGSTISKKGTFIEIDCPASLEIKADEELMGFLLEELMSNAIKFNNKAEKIIKVQCAHHGDSISISVRDYGTGIRPQDVNKIFERFYQVDDYFTGQIEGWGLGLPMVRKILDLHGGSISVISDRGLGSIFTVSIPVS
ncbi:MAG TPA: HAMP domain-containing histidine kinase [Candidatus Avelusimicrobium excrementipullorum]|nr:HAMP domain-containing histidine kinase [Candidatus Avelusimicrobium excrementipullorum]